MMLLIDNREPESIQALLAVLAASIRKVKAGLKHAASEEFQDYPPGILELGTALDAIDMIANDILRFVEKQDRGR